MGLFVCTVNLLHRHMTKPHSLYVGGMEEDLDVEEEMVSVNTASL